MLKNYFITAVRNLFRNKGTSIINLLGFGLGIGVFMLILLFITQELKVDKFIENKDRIFRLEAGEWAILGPGFAQKAKNLCPEVEEAYNLHPYFLNNAMVQVDDQLVRVNGYMPVTPSMPVDFGFNFVLGNAVNPLADTYSAVLTESEAHRLFGKENPIGKVFTIYDKHNITVTAVVEDPTFFHIPFKALLSFDLVPTIYGWKDMDRMLFNNMNNPTYLKLASADQKDEVLDRLTRYFEEEANFKLPFSLVMRPIGDIYFKGALTFEGYAKHGNINFIRVMAVVAILILSLASVNYINLSTARASMRAKEIGVRKVTGASRTSIIMQFIGESILTTLFALAVGIALVEITVPFFSTLVERQLSTSLFFSYKSIMQILLGGVLLGTISGLYPSLYLSSFAPTRVLKGSLADGVRGGVFRKVLIIFQFTVSVALIISTLIIFSQLNYFTNYDLGFDKDQIINLKMPRKSNFGYNVFKNKVLNITSVKGISQSNSTMGNIGWQESYKDDFGDSYNYSYIPVDPDFIDVMGLEIIKGRNFDWDRPADMRDKTIINETMATELGIDSLAGVKLTGGFYETEIIGIVKDFHFNSLHSGIGPLGLHFRGRDYNTYNIKVDTELLNETLSKLKTVWAEYSIDEPFEYTFLNESFEQTYRSEKRMGQMFGYFALIAIFIGCMGLLGLSAFMLQARVKEMGIRKVLGASVFKIISLMGREFAVLVVISNAIAWPIAYYAMHSWLQGFPYRTSIGLVFFVLALAISLLVAFATVAYHAWKTAKSNPIDALKYE